MRKHSYLAGQFAVSAAMAALIATSAFADSRPQEGSRPVDGRQRGVVQRDAATRDSRGDAAARGDNRANNTADAWRSAKAENRNAPEWNRGEERRGTPERDRGTYDRNSRDNNRDSNRNNSRDQNRDNNRGTWERHDRDNNRGTYDRNGRNDRNDRNDNRGTYDRNNHGTYGNRGTYDRNNHGTYGRGSSYFRNPNFRSGFGTVRSYSRERDGWRVYIAGSPYPYWIPFSHLHDRQLRVGLSLRLGGIFRDGGIWVDVLGWPGDPYYNDPYYYDSRYDHGYYGGYNDYRTDTVRGIVDRVDYRTGAVWIRDDYRRDVVVVDMRTLDGRSRLGLNDIRRGDRVEVAGTWRGRAFDAYRIESIDAY